MIRRAAALGLTAALLASPLVARGDPTKAECVKANADGQADRIAGRFGAAREKLAACADPACPTLVRDDCAQRTDELDRVEPTIIFEAKDASGGDAIAVDVSIDGRPAERLGGTAMHVDPGEHTFTFTTDGAPPVTRTFVLREGEKERRERVLIGATAPSPAPATAEGSGGGGLGAQRALAFAAGGLGVVGVALGSVFGILSISAASRQKTDCATSASCADHAAALSDHSSATTFGAASTVGFVAGGALLATGLTLLLAAPSKPERSARPVVRPAWGPGFAAVSLGWAL